MAASGKDTVKRRARGILPTTGRPQPLPDLTSRPGIQFLRGGAAVTGGGDLNRSLEENRLGIREVRERCESQNLLVENRSAQGGFREQRRGKENRGEIWKTAGEGAGVGAVKPANNATGGVIGREKGGRGKGTRKKLEIFLRRKRVGMSLKKDGYMLGVDQGGKGRTLSLP